MITEQQIKETANKIGEKFSPEKIILFGSYAWGKPTENSDVDFFIVKETDNTRDMSRKISRFVFPRPFPIDIIVYTPEQIEKRKQMRDFFLKDILTSGRVLFSK